MKFYKIRHKPTGLFFKPSKYASKVHLSKQGKVYAKKPTLNYLGDTYHHPLPKDSLKNWPYYENRKVVLEDWEIVEYTVTETVLVVNERNDKRT